MFEKNSNIPSFKRENKTIDIVKRIGIITANRVFLKKYPQTNPITVFNPGLILLNEELKLYVRITLGYYTYASAVAEITIPLEELNKEIFHKNYSGEIVVFPDNKYDIWGVEDPRVYKIDNEIIMTYCGRTVNYFDPTVKVERTLPVCAKKLNEKWDKICVFRFPKEMRKNVVSDKNAFLVNTKNGMKLFHRPHLKNNKFYLTISEIDNDIRNKKDSKIEEIQIKNTVIVYEPSKFEEKIGWGAPPIEIENKYLFLAHGVDKELKFYKVFAMLMDKNLNIISVTPYYIMKPKEIYEIYGDRPHAIFPCGAVVVDDKIIISYGAADSVVGLGEIKIDELMNILDKNII
ncbi:MAG TPA: glycosidase [Nanoarchaeota archaeon]|nr:glycosidase [Nanoarchaeota archaeon]